MWYAVGLLSVFLIIFAFRLWRVERKLQVLFGGSREKSFEALVGEHHALIGTLQQESKAIQEAVGVLEESFLRSVQKVGVVRFNPFANSGGSGGDQSFAIALLDGNDNGIALSGIYVQGRPMVYAKPIEKGVSRYALSGEEEEALRRAGKILS